MGVSLAAVAITRKPVASIAMVSARIGQLKPCFRENSSLERATLRAAAVGHRAAKLRERWRKLVKKPPGKCSQPTLKVHAYVPGVPVRASYLRMCSDYFMHSQVHVCESL
eukprot:6056834-Pleurochrysis_carterae.AAC.2